MTAKYRRNIEIEREYAAVPSARRYDLLGLVAFFATTAVALASLIV